MGCGYEDKPTNEKSSTQRLTWCHKVMIERGKCNISPINMDMILSCFVLLWLYHDDVIKWKHFPRYWPFVRGIHRSPVNYLHKGRWRAALVFSLICAWINGWVNNREADLRRHRAHYDVIVMLRVLVNACDLLIYLYPYSSGLLHKWCALYENCM